MNIRWLLLTVGCGIQVAAGPCQAAQVTYRFTATVQMINPSAIGFPASLAGVSVGAPVTGRITYEGTTAPSPNSFPTPFSLATYYVLANSAVTLTIGGVTLGTWSGLQTALVWNNDVINGPGMNDGLLFSNVGGTNMMQYQIGNLALPTTTLASEALPTSTLAGGYILELWTTGAQQGAWLRTSAWSGFTLAPPCPADIAPSAPNGAVNVDDLLAVINAWGPCANPNNCRPDIAPPGGNDVVNVDDLLAVINGWGACP